MVGLLVMFLFIAALVLFNSPNLLLTNKVAYATGVTSVTILGEAVSGAAIEDALAILVRIASTPAPILAGGGTSGLTTKVTNAVSAISTLSNTGQLTPNKNLAISAIKQILLGLIQHTIKIIQDRITAIPTAIIPPPTSVPAGLLRQTTPSY